MMKLNEFYNKFWIMDIVR
jgi:hypothetical protein